MLALVNDYENNVISELRMDEVDAVNGSGLFVAVAVVVAVCAVAYYLGREQGNC